MEIVTWVEAQVAAKAYAAGDRLPPEHLLCKQFGVSRQTVRRALDELEKKGYISRVQGSGTYISGGYAPLGGPAVNAGRKPTVEFISTHLSGYIYPAIVNGIENVLSANGYELQLSFTKNQSSGERRALQSTIENPPDGLIIEATKSGLPCLNQDLYRVIQRMDVPFIFIDSCHASVPAPLVAMDDEKAGYIATQHLLGMGHREITGIFTVSNSQGHLRYMGHARALLEAGITMDDNRIVWYTKETRLDVMQGEQLRQALAESSAALCYNDEIGIKVIELLRKQNRHAPDNFSIVGIDNSELASVCNLTSVAHPLDKLGEAAAHLLLSMMNGAAGKNILLSPRLVVRDSVRSLADDDVG